MLFAHLNWLINALEDPWRYYHLNLMIEVGIGKCTGSPVKRKGLSSKEGVKLFFIFCRGLGGLLLFMSATMDAWVRGKHYCGMSLSRPWSFSLRCHWKMSSRWWNLSTQASWCSGSCTWEPCMNKLCFCFLDIWLSCYDKF